MTATRELRIVPADPNAGYMLDTYADRDRLYLQFDLYQPILAGALDRALAHAGVPRALTDGGYGVRLLDVGCGEGLHLADALRRYPQCQAVGLDRDPEAVSTASAAYVDRSGLSFHRADIHQPVPELFAPGVPGQGFDVAQLILSLLHLRDAHAALVNVRQALRPGGTILVFDTVDDGVTFPHPSFERIASLQGQLMARMGTPHAAQRHGELLAQAGFTMCESVDVVQEMGGHTESGRLALTCILLAMRSARRAIVDVLHLMDADEYERHMRRLATEIDPATTGLWRNRLSIARKE